MKHNQEGFTLVEGILVLIFVTLIGFAGWYVWNANNKDKSTSNDTKGQTQTTSQATSSSKNTLSLASDTVSLVLPDGWTYKMEDYCLAADTADVECLENGYITTNTKSTSEEVGYLSVAVGVYKNPESASPQDWIKNTLHEGQPVSGDQTSNKAINGNQAFFWNRLASESPAYIYYVITSDDKAFTLDMSAEDATSQSARANIEQQFQELANSVKIN